MSQIEKAILDLGALDCLARQRTAIHGIDPRAKVAVCLVFIATVASFDKYGGGPCAICGLPCCAHGSRRRAYIIDWSIPRLCMSFCHPGRRFQSAF